MDFNINIEGTPPTQAELDKVKEDWEQELLMLDRKYNLYCSAIVFSFIGLLGSMIGFLLVLELVLELEFSHNNIGFLSLWGLGVLGLGVLGFGVLIIYSNKRSSLAPSWDLKEKINELKEIDPKAYPEVFTHLNEWGKKDERIKSYFKAVAEQGRLPLECEYNKVKEDVEVLRLKTKQEKNKDMSLSQWKELTD